MSYLAVLTFDIRNAKSEDYACADQQLAAIGFAKKLTNSNSSTVELPFNTYAGQFNGTNPSDVWKSLASQAKQALLRCNVHGRLFLVVSDNWAWGTDTF